MSLTKVSYSMIQGSVKSVSDYGAVGDGVADDTAALQAMLNDCSNKTIIFPAGTYKITSALSATTLTNCTIIGYGQATITGNYGRDLIFFCDTTNFTLDGIVFDNQYVNAALSGGAGCVSWGELAGVDCNIENVIISNCTFTNPNTQNMALFIAFRTVQDPPAQSPVQPYRTGVMKNFTIANNKFLDCGSIAMTIMNRQTSSDRYTAISNVKVINNYVKNLGTVSGATYGFFISLDGFGQDFEISGNSIYGHLGNAIENVGWINGVINGNIVGAGKPGTFRMISLDGGQTFSGPGGGSTTAPLSGIVFSNNIAMVDQTFYDLFFKVNNSCFSNNIHRTGAAPLFGALSMLDCTFTTTSGSQFFSNNRAAISLGDATGVTTKNIFTNCIFDNSSSAASTATVFCTGAGTTFNTLTGVLNSAGTGTTFVQADSAANNVFTSLV